MKKKIFMGLGTLALVVAGVFATKANKNAKPGNTNAFYTYTGTTYTVIIQSSCTTTPFTALSGSASFNGKSVYYYYVDGLNNPQYTQAKFVF